MSAASFLHSSFLQAINAVMLWPVHVERVSQASEHLCPAKQQTRLEGCGFTGFQVFTGLRCSRFEKPVRSKKNRKTGFYRGHNY